MLQRALQRLDHAQHVNAQGMQALCKRFEDPDMTAFFSANASTTTFICSSNVISHSTLSSIVHKSQLFSNATNANN